MSNFVYNNEHRCFYGIIICDGEIVNTKLNIVDGSKFIDDIVNNVQENIDKLSIKYKECACNDLLNTANEWNTDWDENFVNITKEEFINNLTPVKIIIDLIESEPQLTIVYSASDMLFGNNINVYGNMEEADYANIRGKFKRGNIW